MRRILSAIFFLSCGCFAQSRPNVIFFFVDDLGYGDLGCFWQDQRSATKKFDTPALDRMAAEGAMLTHHYISASVCAPSRGSLLQGRHQGHCDIRNSQFDKAIPQNHTIASVLKAAGYRTIHIGKNGIAGSESSTNLIGTGSQNLAAHPQNRGFDRFFGYLFHADGHEHFPANGTTDKNAHIYDGYRQVKDASVDLYTTDAWTAAAKKEIIAEATDGDDQPFFLYLAYDTPHFKMQRPAVAYPPIDGDGDPLTGGIQWTTATDSTGKIRYASTANGTGVVDAYTHPDLPSGWATAEKQHVGMIRHIDDSIADILRTLQDLGIDNNTICVFSSDNGPHNEGNDPRTFGSYANMEGTKRDMWEAGIRVPTIVRWPGQIAGTTGSENNIHAIDHPSAIWDWMPTFCDIAGVPAPAWCDGVSLVPTLTGSGTQRDKGYLYFEFQSTGTTPNWIQFPNHGGEARNEMQCIRIGTRMGVRTGITTGAEPFEIYDVSADPGQATDLAASLPAVQARMQYLARTARRPGAGVSRPYDGLSLPAAGPQASVPGVNWKSFTDAGASWQWVPEFRDLEPGASGVASGIDLSVRPAEENFGILYTGYINVPAAGNYTFYLGSDTGASLFLHDGHLIDDDFNHTGSATSAPVPLSAGLHPYRLYYRHATGARSLALDWSGPGLSRQPVPSSAFVVASTAAPSPPVANDDSATTGFQRPVLIDVLANDTDDGTPNPLAIHSVGTPTAGLAVLEGSKIRFTPANGFSGVATFGYTVTDGAETDGAIVTVTVEAAADVVLWTTTFSGSPATDGANRILTNTNGDASFIDILSADDANLTFQDTSFSGSVFMNAGTMASGAYYSPRTNVDNPAAVGQNGGWWQTEFRYTGGSQAVDLSGIIFTMAWSNSAGNIQTTGNSFGTTIRDITLTAEYSLNGGASWLRVSDPQTYDVTEPDGQEQIQLRTFAPPLPLTVNHATEDLWVRVRAENANGTAGAYVNIQSVAFVGKINDYTVWAGSYPGADLTDPNDDLDGDGQTNNEERLWGLDPTKGSNPSPISSFLKSPTPTFTYTRRNPLLSRADFTYQYSTSLQTDGWHAFTPLSETPTGTSPVESVTVRIPAEIQGAKFFLRVLATEN